MTTLEITMRGRMSLEDFEKNFDALHKVMIAMDRLKMVTRPIKGESNGEQEV
jgi:hypothetical protein